MNTNETGFVTKFGKLEQNPAVTKPAEARTKQGRSAER